MVEDHKLATDDDECEPRGYQTGGAAHRKMRDQQSRRQKIPTTPATLESTTLTSFTRIRATTYNIVPPAVAVLGLRAG